MSVAPGCARTRLKPTVEAFPASDGNVYILRGAELAQYVVADPGPLDRALLEELAYPGPSDGDLLASLGRRGLRAGEGEVAERLEQLGGLGLLDPPEAAGVGTLSTEESARYDRQLLYFSDAAPPGTDPAHLQRRLLAARVVVIGCGGLGSWTLCGLACAGVGTLVLVDDDRIELGNLNRQLLFRRSDVGRPKVEVAADALRAFNPGLSVETVPRRVRGVEDVRRVIRGAELVVCTADWPIYEIQRWVNAACVQEGVAHVSAGQIPPTVRVGPLYVPGASACHECQESSGRRRFPLYDELVAFRQSRPVVAATLGPASGLVGSILSMEAIHHLTGLTSPATLGTALVLDLRSYAVHRESVERQPDCSVCGAPPVGPVARLDG
jgi:molybdopterin/thiamine biosynthesis adenylyltransferase